MRCATTLFLAGLLAGSSLTGQQPGVPILSPAPPEAACPRAPIACGGSVTGSIEETDCKIANGSYADIYALPLPDKRFVTVEMASTDFDSFLIVRNEKAMKDIPAFGNAPLQIMIRDDDNSGGGKNARVEAGAENPDIWYVMARGKKGRSRGSYTLSVKCEGLTCEPGRNAICLNRMRFRVMVHYTDLPDFGFGPSSDDKEKATFDWYGPPATAPHGTAEVSVTDHCAEDGHFWVSAEAAVSKPIRISVTDTRTGAEKVYESKAGEAFQPVEDRNTFRCP
ncbi:MAG: hypothetical protein QOH06_1005 [Acidobacteriota bacterium]|jgi:hypothetical protein|nr:hypothetical protein [Acidobacteriota bacterium]